MKWPKFWQIKPKNKLITITQSTPTPEPQEDRLKTILKAAKRRVGLKPFYQEHMSATPIVDDIDQPKYSAIRKESAAEFLAN